MAEGIGILIRPWVRKYVAGVALNGVPIRYPQISPTTNRWMLFNPITGAYEDSGVVARGASPYIDLTTGTWLLWNDATAAYVDSGVKATGPQGEVPQFRVTGRRRRTEQAHRAKGGCCRRLVAPFTGRYRGNQCV
jgi:hypothetical protein